MGNRLNRFLNKIGIFKKRPKIFILGKNHRLKEVYKKIHKKANKLVFDKDPIRGVLENIEIESYPLKDDSTGQDTYFVIEGENKTIDPYALTARRSEQDDLMMNTAFERGRDVERAFREDKKIDKNMLYMVVVMVAVMLVNIVLSWQILSVVG